ncbi:MAG: hypothetical protein KDK70_02210 [Myxococcales bacterium]|nr:hypothetical protein [Myxococcales bacterium]
MIQSRRALLSLALAAVATTTVACRLKTERPPVAAEATAPEFDLADQFGNTVTLTELLVGGPAILVFYRGHW